MTITLRTSNFPKTDNSMIDKIITKKMFTSLQINQYS